MNNDYRDYLQHHGVKGMKWGVRRSSKSTKKSRHKTKTRTKTKTGSHKPKAIRRIQQKSRQRKQKRYDFNHPTKEALMESTSATQIYKHRSKLSDQELRNRINRIQMEQQLSSLSKKEQRMGRTMAGKFANQCANRLTNAAVAAAVGATIAAARSPVVRAKIQRSI